MGAGWRRKAGRKERRKETKKKKSWQHPWHCFRGGWKDAYMCLDACRTGLEEWAWKAECLGLRSTSATCKLSEFPQSVHFCMCFNFITYKMVIVVGATWEGLCHLCLVKNKESTLWFQDIFIGEKKSIYTIKARHDKRYMHVLIFPKRNVHRLLRNELGRFSIGSCGRGHKDEEDTWLTASFLWVWLLNDVKIFHIKEWHCQKIYTP